MVDTTDEATINIILLKYVPNNGTACNVDEKETVKFNKC